MVSPKRFPGRSLEVNGFSGLIRSSPDPPRPPPHLRLPRTPTSPIDLPTPFKVWFKGLRV